MSTALAPVTTDDRMANWREQFCKGASPAEFDQFVRWCARTGLDPEQGHCYWHKQSRKPAARIDGIRAKAQRTGRYNGQTEPQWCGPDGIWRDAWLEPGPPAAAKIGVYIIGAQYPTYAVAHWRGYGSSDNRWAKDPAGMLMKCAEALALRKAFPDDLGDVYSGDELDQAAPQPAAGRPQLTAAPTFKHPESGTIPEQLAVVEARKPVALPAPIDEQGVILDYDWQDPPSDDDPFWADAVNCRAVLLSLARAIEVAPDNKTLKACFYAFEPIKDLYTGVDQELIATALRARKAQLTKESA